MAVFCAIVFLPKAAKDVEEIQIRADTEPIYNHFPDFPATENMQWCSRALGGIGPATVWMYVFAFYDYDVGSEFPGEEAFVEKTDFYFLPKEPAENNAGWMEAVWD